MRNTQMDELAGLDLRGDAGRLQHEETIPAPDLLLVQHSGILKLH
jgi:hypothetical protein